MMSDTDEKKPKGKAARRKRNSDQRSRKSDQPRKPKADQMQAAKQPIDAKLLASTDTAPIAPHDARAEADAHVAASEALPVAMENVAVRKAASPIDVTPIGVQDEIDTPVVTAESFPIATQNVEERTSAFVAATETAPVATQNPDERADASTPAIEVAPVDIPVSAAAAPVSLQTIADAYSDYTRKSIEQTRSFFEKLTGVRSLDKAIEVQAEFAKQAFETFVAEAQRIRELHRELARQSFEGIVAKASQAARILISRAGALFFRF